ncbi:diguanylate cyclase [Bdellovibrio sp. HCB2-146]|uniref:sensor domain-containing diguanylate cyclase n=1 Tax=Bdellovibrio sp. HCB2-146 TaxID=3394362 RepID=UPI0039BCF806
MTPIFLADAAIFDFLPVGVLILSEDKKIIYCNEAFAGILRTPLRRLKPGSPLSKSIPESSEIFSVLNLETGHQKEITLNLPSGINPTLRVNCQPVRLDQDVHYLISMQDVSIEKHLHERYKSVSKDSVTDEKTGLYNSRYFETALSDEFKNADNKSATRLGLIIVDIDHFKQVNDKHGHLVGDEVLKDVSARIRESLPDNAMAARYGGEEFCILVRDTTEGELMAYSDKLRLSIANSGQIRVTVSMGVSLVSSKTTSSRLLFETADEALYEAKNSGRNRVILRA